LFLHIQVSDADAAPRLHVVTFRPEPGGRPRPEYAGPADHVRTSGNRLNFRISTEGVSFSGTISSGTLSGTWTNADSSSFPVIMDVVAPPPFLYTHQQPRPPFPYIAEEVTVSGGLFRPRLSGTLTRPAAPGSFPAVLLLSGQGPEGRDAENQFHRPFLVWADHLTRMGMVVLRCDDRGVGLSEGDFNAATTADFAADARMCLDFLKARPEVHSGRIGMLGHSEGGLVAATVAAESPDVGFIVLLAPPVCPMKEIWKHQFGVMARRNGLDARTEKLGEEFIEGAWRNLAANSATYWGRNSFRNYFIEYMNGIPEKDRRLLGFPANEQDEAAIEKELNVWCTPWKYFITRFDAADAYNRVACPVLGVFAGLDEQILPKPNAELLETLLKTGRNPPLRLHVFPDLEHGMRRPINYNAASYPLSETVAIEVLELVSSWITSLPEKAQY